MTTGYPAALAIGLLAFGGAAFAQQDSGPPRWMANIERHHQVVLNGVPQPYSAMHDPSPDSSSRIREGAALFDRHCAACHGITGQGSGPDSFALVPPPADLDWLVRSPARTAQPYMYWSIAEGGASFGSEMPAFKNSLEEKDVWAVIAYIRAGYPQ